MRTLVSAMDALVRDDDVSEFILILQAFYLFGYRRVAIAIGVSNTELYHLVRRGEALLIREMKRH